MVVKVSCRSEYNLSTVYKTGGKPFQTFHFYSIDFIFVLIVVVLTLLAALHRYLRIPPDIKKKKMIFISIILPNNARPIGFYVEGYNIPTNLCRAGRALCDFIVQLLSFIKGMSLCSCLSGSQ